MLLTTCMHQHSYANINQHPRPQDKLLLGYSSLVDCWAAGVLAYELLTGRPPFEQDTREATCEHIMYHKAPHPPWMPEDARAFISTALSKVPHCRHTYSLRLFNTLPTC